MSETETMVIWTLDFIRRECGLLRNPIPTIRECSIQIIEQTCIAAIDRLAEQRASGSPAMSGNESESSLSTGTVLR